MVEDFRPKEEIAVEKRAQSPLDPDDEKMAKQLVVFVEKAVDIARTKSDWKSDPEHQELEREIQEIGEKLCSEGGNDRMLLIFYRYVLLGGGRRILELFWNGICGWMY